MKRRAFLSMTAAGTGALALHCSRGATPAVQKPNVLFILADQWRAQATGYAGDPNLQGKTPNLDRLAAESVNFVNAVSSCPVCTPYRASLITGRYPLTHGLFLNDLCLSNDAVSIAQAYGKAGYDTAYIGKWHLDGHGRSEYIPPERRQGFRYWKVLECTHAYNRSAYYAGNDQTKRLWPGYDVIAQTHDAQAYLGQCADTEKPFFMVLSWGPPHNPYETAPEKYRALFDAASIRTRPNVKGDPRQDLAGYYAHIAAMDACLGELMETLDRTGLHRNTIVVFTSDHGDMIGSQGERRKQRPWDEAIRVPFLLRCPPALAINPRAIGLPLNTPDIMPTLLSLCGLAPPDTVEGADWSTVVRGAPEPEDHAALIQCPSPFGEWERRHGGREYRGLRTRRYTYVRDLNGPWLLYDNERDPYQLDNLVGQPAQAALQVRLDARLQALLKARNDAFLPGEAYIRQWGYTVNENGTVQYRP